MMAQLELEQEPVCCVAMELEELRYLVRSYVRLVVDVVFLMSILSENSFCCA